MDRPSPEGYNVMAYSGTGTPYIKEIYGSNTIYLSSFRLYNTYTIHFV